MKKRVIRVLERLIVKLVNKAENIYWALIYRRYRDSFDIHPSFRFNGKGIIFYGGGRLRHAKEVISGGTLQFNLSRGVRLR